MKLIIICKHTGEIISSPEEIIDGKCPHCHKDPFIDIENHDQAIGCHNYDVWDDDKCNENCLDGYWIDPNDSDNDNPVIIGD